jgi:hypothetical protein
MAMNSHCTGQIGYNSAMIGAVAVKVLISGIFIKLVVSAVLFFGLYVIMLYIMREEVITENVNRILSRFIKK